MIKLKFLRAIGVLIISLPGITFSLPASAQQDPAPTGQQVVEPKNGSDPVGCRRGPLSPRSRFGIL